MKQFFKNFFRNIVAALIGILCGVMIFQLIDINYLQKSFTGHFSKSVTPKEKAEAVLKKTYQETQNTTRRKITDTQSELPTENNNTQPETNPSEIIKTLDDDMFNEVDVSINKDNNSRDFNNNKTSSQEDVKKKITPAENLDASNNSDTNELFLKEIDSDLEDIAKNNNLMTTEQDSNTQTISNDESLYSSDNNQEQRLFDAIDPVDDSEKKLSDKNNIKNLPPSLLDDSYSILNEELSQPQAPSKNPVLDNTVPNTDDNSDATDEIFSKAKPTNPKTSSKSFEQVQPLKQDENTDSIDTQNLIQEKRQQTDTNIDSSIPKHDVIMGTLRNQLSIPEESIEELGAAQNKEIGIIPDDNIFTNSSQEITGTIKGSTINNNSTDIFASKDNKNNTNDDNQEINLELTTKNAVCAYEHTINTVEKEETFKLLMTIEGSKPIKMSIKRPLELYQYLNMSLEQVDNYPSEFSVLSNFCTTMTVNKSVIEEY